VLTVTRRGTYPRQTDQQNVEADQLGLANAETVDQGPWRLAIGDVHSAYMTGTDDSFVFAYRAVEDLARAQSPTADKDWGALHSLLATTEKAFRRRTRRLYLARNAVAHGDPEDPDLLWARQRRERLLRLSRSIVREALTAKGLPS
jgi:hypothetical protein